MHEANPEETEPAAQAELARLPPREARRLFREGRHTGPTAGIAPGHVQANLVVLSAGVADAFEAYCRANPKPCPLLERLTPGDPITRQLAGGADIRTDLPRYRVYRPDGTFEECLEVRGGWRDEDVAFLLGCSFSFEEALTRVGLVPRHVEEGVNVPMYRTSRETTPAEPFAGPLVVSMRPIPRERVEDAYEITRPFAWAHGEPVHHGDPATLSITDLARPDWGEAVTIREGEVPVFWACGVTSQTAVMNALRSGAADRVITHAPGHMFIGDRRNTEFG